MAKIIFYEEEVAKLVEDFMNKIRANGARKANFIDAKAIEERTKISITDKSTTIATTLTSIAGLINDLFILYPCSGTGTVLPAMTDTRVKEENIENVSVSILRLTEENMDNIDGMEYIDLDPATTEITENTFIPDIKRILYLMTSERAGELVKNATQNSAIHITDVAELASHFDYEDSVRVSIAIPQLSTGSWIDFFDTLELVLERNRSIQFISNAHKMKEITSSEAWLTFLKDHSLMVLLNMHRMKSHISRSLNIMKRNRQLKKKLQQLMLKKFQINPDLS